MVILLNFKLSNVKISICLPEISIYQTNYYNIYKCIYYLIIRLRIRYIIYIIGNSIIIVIKISFNVF
jgi:hypothetical protein